MDKRKIVGMLLRAFELDRKIDDEISFQKDFAIPSVYRDLKIELSILPKEGDGGYVKMASEAVKVTGEAYNALTEIYNESTLSMRQIASILIIEGSKHIVYDKVEV